MAVFGYTRARMKPQENVSLKNYSTMRLGGNARYLTEVSSNAELETAINWAEQAGIANIIMIGVGSNIVWSDQGYDGLVIVNRIQGFELQPQGDHTFLTAGAGEVWDSVVERTVKEGLSGIENLSLIPGTTGATPVQNVGAYGKEISDVFVCLQAYDRELKKFVTIPKIECGFGYRTSKFKTTERGRFLISSITLSLTPTKPMPPFYASLERYLTENKITDYTPESIRQAVIAVRNSKLPDPAKVANCGSFFANPIIPRYQVEDLKEKFPGIMYWDKGDDKVKISAAWLLEYLGLKGYHEPVTGMATWDNQPLVFVNEKAKNTASLIAFRDAIVQAVDQKFGIQLEQEPELI